VARRYGAHMRHALFVAGLLGVACASNQARVEPSSASADSDGLTFIEDDLSGALARAKAEGKPLFVDAWAPW
jgi:hypothetical protein